MSVKIEKVEKNQVKLEIEVEAKIFDECMNKAFNKNKSGSIYPVSERERLPETWLRDIMASRCFMKMPLTLHALMRMIMP